MRERLSDENDGQAEAAQTPVAVGTHVQLELLTESGTSEAMAFDVVPDSSADFAAGFLGAGTPLAQAILGQWAGSRVPYRAADIVEVRILAVTSSAHSPDDDTAAKRQG